MKRRAAYRLAGYILALFVAGAITGGVVGHRLAEDRLVRTSSAPELVSRMRARLISRLDLTPEQLGRIEPILNHTAARLQSVNGDCLKRVESILKESSARIAAELTPVQRLELDRLEKEREDLFSRKCRPKNGGSDRREREKNPSPKTSEP